MIEKLLRKAVITIILQRVEKINQCTNCIKKYAERKIFYMIKLTRLNGTVILINENFIELAEETPDTVVTMENGHRYLVQEKLDDIVTMIKDFRKETRASE